MATLRAQLRSDAYRAYSIWAQFSSGLLNPPTRTAISENPIAILDHVNSQDLGLPYVQLQSSDSQVSVNSYKFHAIFGERQSARQIFNEFGAICATNLWIGDSGALNFRTYQESAGAAINRTFTQDDFLRDSFSLGTSPMADLLSDVTVHYGYQFHLNKMNDTLRAFPANNALCNSLNNSGLKSAAEFATRFVIATATASYWLGNITRLMSQQQEAISASLGPRHMDLELYDVLRVRHPMLVGSEALYQITGLSMHPLEGWVSFTAGRLLAVTGN